VEQDSIVELAYLIGSSEVKPGTRSLFFYHNFFLHLLELLDIYHLLHPALPTLRAPLPVSPAPSNGVDFFSGFMQALVLSKPGGKNLFYHPQDVKASSWSPVPIIWAQQILRYVIVLFDRFFFRFSDERKLRIFACFAFARY
jgi:hypothetical protein